MSVEPQSQTDEELVDSMFAEPQSQTDEELVDSMGTAKVSNFTRDEICDQLIAEIDLSTNRVGASYEQSQLTSMDEEVSSEQSQSTDMDVEETPSAGMVEESVKPTYEPNGLPAPFSISEDECDLAGERMDVEGSDDDFNAYCQDNLFHLN